MHELEQDIEEPESVDPVQSEYRMTVGNRAEESNTRLLATMTRTTPELEPSRQQDDFELDRYNVHPLLLQVGHQNSNPLHDGHEFVTITTRPSRP
ncbi:hypothetical protein TNCV_1015571 [Trichonephila clavipes]|uniref:Uncharacterized protein n=1 Tax=Trichonephila clavipes TaxID=2585209 RepID=A0A8X7B9U5_TRICX|nr:hypothetical protein TNCV_1015571 [Trichonephila clavipes]